ncbi:MAG TPA: hypothetical protein VLB74_08295 [Flavobacterium sp.]|uniref:hypothetical protein n=1 Tax=Flavobacterium sp. TaxID=239 RepID=UPI002C1BDFB1|nr:hypothetical protein [Flavobacterium sp.]HSD14634.1 hypothetical protein [Flavobacterium sp.]
MKYLTAILTFYFVLLIGVPTMREVKTHFLGGCVAMSEGGGCCSGGEIPEGCEKEKCILNMNFSTGQFIVQQIQNISIPVIFEEEKQERLIYEKTFIPYYYNTFWHPPEMNS